MKILTYMAYTYFALVIFIFIIDIIRWFIEEHSARKELIRKSKIMESNIKAKNISITKADVDKANFATCNSIPTIPTKNVLCDPFELKPYSCIFVKFRYGNTAKPILLSINGTSHIIYDKDNKENEICEGEVVLFVFDGEYWQIVKEVSDEDGDDKYVKNMQKMLQNNEAQER